MTTCRYCAAEVPDIPTHYIDCPEVLYAFGPDTPVSARNEARRELANELRRQRVNAARRQGQPRRVTKAVK